MGLDTERATRDELDGAESVISRRFSEAVLWLRSRKTIEAIALLIKEHRLTEILDDADLKAAAEHIASGVTDSYISAATQVSEYLTLRLDSPVIFDQTNVLAVERMRSKTIAVVGDFSTEQLTTLRQTLVDGVEQGLNPRAQARIIRGNIGLTPNQQQIVSNFRDKLVTGSQDALNYELRDKRFDGTIKRGEPLTASQTDKMVGRYQDKFISFRATVIGRTEALGAVHQGAREMWRQIVESGDVAASDIVRKWKHSSKRNKNQRSGHIAMDGDTRGLDEPFVTPDGVEIMHPGDPNAPISETAQCACLVTVRIVRAPA